MYRFPDVLGDNIGSVQLVNSMGNDLTVVNAARVSFDKESNWEPTTSQLKAEDVKLINYLAKHNHWTPFGHVQISMRVKAPIFVARQLVKHQVGLVWNEVSRRYVKGDVEIYLPNAFRLAPEGSIKQGSSSETTTAFVPRCEDLLEETLSLYETMLTAGIAPEEARMILPLSSYTEWIWTGSLMAWIRIAKLRCDSHAQSQTQAYGKAFGNIVKLLCPVSAKAWGLDELLAEGKTEENQNGN